MNFLNKIKAAWKDSIKERTDWDYIGDMAGHKWGKPATISDMIAERYFAFQKLSEQFDTLGIRYSELWRALELQQSALRANNIALASEYNTALMGYVELRETNDMIFSIPNCFVLIDDEPINEMTSHHTKLKKKLFDENPEIRIFFCEFYNILKPNTPISNGSINPSDFLKDRLRMAAEHLYFKLTKVPEN